MTFSLREEIHMIYLHLGIWTPHMDKFLIPGHKRPISNQSNTVLQKVAFLLYLPLIGVPDYPIYLLSVMLLVSRPKLQSEYQPIGSHLVISELIL